MVVLGLRAWHADPFWAVYAVFGVGLDCNFYVMAVGVHKMNGMNGAGRESSSFWTECEAVLYHACADATTAHVVTWV